MPALRFQYEPENDYRECDFYRVAAVGRCYCSLARWEGVMMLRPRICLDKLDDDCRAAWKELYD